MANHRYHARTPFTDAEDRALKRVASIAKCSVTDATAKIGYSRGAQAEWKKRGSMPEPAYHALHGWLAQHAAKETEFTPRELSCLMNICLDAGENELAKKLSTALSSRL
jgi:hypothetical protein